MDTKIVARILDLAGQKFKEQQDFADALGISPKVLSTWKRKENPVKSWRGCIKKIAEVLGVSVEYLLTGEEQKSAPSVPTDEESVANLIDQLSPQQLTELIARASEKLRQLM